MIIKLTGDNYFVNLGELLYTEPAEAPMTIRLFWATKERVYHGEDAQRIVAALERLAQASDGFTVPHSTPK